MTFPPETPDDGLEDSTRISRPAALRTSATESARTPTSYPVDQTGGGAHPASTIAVGSILSHTYVIEAFLARGGMGEVYRARHQELGSIHAIKVILPELTQDPGVVTMFTEEARKLRRVREDGVVAYEGLFRDEAGRLYLVMEFADGPSLSQVLRERRLTVAEVRFLRDRLALGLAAAHDKGIFHRDLSPDNVILVDGKTELAKVIDFGIAKSSEPGEVTVVGHDFAGKYSWVAPEQLGLYGGKVDARTDIYSLGLVLGAAASGRTLTPCSTMAEVIMTRQKVPDLTGVPPELHAEIIPLLQPDPARRPASMAELPRSLPKQPRGSSRTLVFAGAAVGALLIAGIAALFLLKPAPGPDQAIVSAPVLSPDTASRSVPAKETGPTLTTAPAAAPENLNRPDLALLVQTIMPQLKTFDCANANAEASGSSSIALTGFVKSAADKDRAAATAANLASGASVDNQLEVVPFPFCAARRVAPLVGASPALSLQVDHSNGLYRIGDFIMVTAAPPPGLQHGWVAIDLIDSEGNVAHMLPAPGMDGAFVAGRGVKIGQKGQPQWQASDPPGPIMILGVASDRPLEQPLKQVEDAATYFPWLEQALRRNGGQLSSTFANVTVVRK